MEQLVKDMSDPSLPFVLNPRVICSILEYSAFKLFPVLYYEIDVLKICILNNSTKYMSVLPWIQEV